MNDANELAGGRNPLDVLDLNFGFNTKDDLEGWSPNTITTPLVADGVLSGIATTNDPKISHSGFSMRGNDVPSVVVEIKAGAAGALQFYWGTATSPGFVSTRVLQPAYPTANAWTAVTLPLAGVSGWAGQPVTSLRIDPISVGGQRFEIDWIRVSNGDLDGDGISDVIEGSADSDGDGLLDLEDLDSDNDGQSDQLEIHAGTNHLDPADHFDWTVTTHGFQPASILMTVKPGRTYRVHSSATLAGGEWDMVDTVHAVTESIHLFTEQAYHPERFYRIEVLLDNP